MSGPVFFLVEIAVLGGVCSLLWIAISLHTLAAHAYEIICILDGTHGRKIKSQGGDNG